MAIAEAGQGFLSDDGVALLSSLWRTVSDDATFASKLAGDADELSVDRKAPSGDVPAIEAVPVVGAAQAAHDAPPKTLPRSSYRIRLCGSSTDENYVN